MLESLIQKSENGLFYDFILSSILNKRQIKDLMNLCGFSDKEKWKLLYRASRDGFSAANFHSKCDGNQNTLTIIRSNLGYVFGGYTQKPWSQKGGWENDSEAFIFSLINGQGSQKKFYCIDPQSAIYCQTGYGPVFGAGNDIFIANNSNQIESSSYIDSYASQTPNDHLNVCNEYHSILAGASNFLTTEIEVFQKF